MGGPVSDLLDALTAELGRWTYQASTEAELQAGVYLVLQRWRADMNARVRAMPSSTIRREFIIGPADRCDFFVDGIVVEVKVGGSVSEVTRQLHRYAQSSKVTGIILVTSRLRQKRMPDELSGKPLRVVWASQL